MTPFQCQHAEQRLRSPIENLPDADDKAHLRITDAAVLNNALQQNPIVIMYPLHDGEDQAGRPHRR